MYRSIFVGGVTCVLTQRQGNNMKQYRIIASQYGAKSVRFNKCMFIHARGCNLNFFDGLDNVVIKKGQYAFLKRHLDVFVGIKKISEGPLFDSVELDEEELDNLVKIIEPMKSNDKRTDREERTLKDKIFAIDKDDVSRFLFERIKKTNDRRLKIYEFACLLSKSNRCEELFNSLASSTTVYFCDRVKKLIESDISRKWRLSLVADALNLSEVAIRKKLEVEKTSFYKILLEVRMQKAAILILRNEYQIRKISTMVGISSSSYFVKVFYSYYGLTPKQFLIYHK